MRDKNCGVTSVQEDLDFRELCLTKNINFNVAMEFLRKYNHDDFRSRMIKSHIPKHLKEPVEAQCLLEGLL